MIADHLERSELYDALGGRFAEAFAYLRSGAHRNLAPGRYQVRGEDVVAMVQEYETADAASKRWESHRKYADIQYVESGEEIIGWTRTESLTLVEDSFADKDIAFFASAGAHAQVRLEPGMFAVFMPADAHMPGCAVHFPAKVRKIVMKVAL